MVSNAERLATELAGRQSGYIIRRQALACGMTPEQIRHRVQTKQWSYLKPGLYLVLGFAPSLRGRLVAATAALGAAVSHESAAEFHNFPDVRRGRAVVTVAIRKTNRFPDVIVHQSTDLTDDQVVEVEGIPVTSPIRTAIDLAARLGPIRIGRIVEYLVLNKMATLDQVGIEVVRLARHGKPGMTCMHKVLEIRTGETLLGESVLEALAGRLLMEWGFPKPVFQMDLPWWSSKRGRVDFAYPAIRLIIEIDGRTWHGTLEAFESDRMRDNLAQIAGWRILRITYRMLKEQPEVVREMIRRAFETSPA
jgi:hypothetical protein